ncbi:hypothetical protein ABVN80_14960 [Acinetobacter baumannii]
MIEKAARPSFNTHSFVEVIHTKEGRLFDFLRMWVNEDLSWHKLVRRERNKGYARGKAEAA